MLKRILLAEDDPRDVELALQGLREKGLANEIQVVNDGEAALDFLYRRGAWADRDPGHPALVLLDLKMPLVSGIEVLEAMRQDDNLRRIPVVVMTSSREEADLARAYELGCNAYVVKPVDFRSFVDAVSAVGLFWAVVNQPPPGCTTNA